MEALQKVKYEDLTPEQKDFVQLVGMETFLMLVQQRGGTSLYIPKAESISRTVRNSAIRAEFTGKNLKQLAARYELSEVQIRAILSQKER